MQDLRRVAALLAVGALGVVLVAAAAAAEQAAVVVGEGVGLLAVDGVVADLEHLVRHAQRDAADELDEHHDERRPDDVPADDEEGADDLEPDLLAVAGDGAAGVGDAEGGAAFGGGPETWRVESVGELSRGKEGGKVEKGMTNLCRNRRQWHRQNACETLPTCRPLCA